MAYQVRDYQGFRLDCEVTTSPECSDILQEAICLTDMVDGFSAVMKAKMMKHLCRGKTGWDIPWSNPDMALITNLVQSISDGDWVSVANYAMILWNRQHME